MCCVLIEQLVVVLEIVDINILSFRHRVSRVKNNNIFQNKILVKYICEYGGVGFNHEQLGSIPHNYLGNVFLFATTATSTMVVGKALATLEACLKWSEKVAYKSQNYIEFLTVGFLA